MGISHFLTVLVDHSTLKNKVVHYALPVEKVLQHYLPFQVILLEICDSS
jgi:hypothetical protein